MSDSDVLGNAVFKSPHTEVYVPKMIVIFVANVQFHSIHESSPRGVQTCLVFETLLFFTQKLAHKYRRIVKFPMLSGMGPVNWLLDRFLHPNIRTWVGFGVKFIFTTSGMHCILLFIFELNSLYLFRCSGSKRILSRTTITLFRQRYPLEN